MVLSCLQLRNQEFILANFIELDLNYLYVAVQLNDDESL